MIQFLIAAVGLGLLTAAAAWLALRRLYGLQTTLALILLSALYFLVLFQIGHQLFGAMP